MLQNELDEISEAFQDAWDEFFGQEMFYIPFKLAETKSHPLYNESRKKVYDRENKLRFMGTYKELSNKEAGELFGDDTKAKAEITFVTKELFDKGIKEVDDSARIEITFHSGVTKEFDITEVLRKVQLGNNRIFTKLGVNEDGD